MPRLAVRLSDGDLIDLHTGACLGGAGVGYDSALVRNSATGTGRVHDAHPDPILRACAAEALGIHHINSAVPELVTALRDGYESVRHAATAALRTIGLVRFVRQLANDGSDLAIRLLVEVLETDATQVAQDDLLLLAHSPGLDRIGRAAEMVGRELLRRSAQHSGAT